MDLDDLFAERDDTVCPECKAVKDYWLAETSKECRRCGHVWTSAWALAVDDPDSQS